MEKKREPGYYKMYVELYRRSKSGYAVYLCSHFEGELFNLVKPTMEDSKKTFSTLMWGRDSWEERSGEFNGLRQNLVLLMAAMNNEL